jgi:hypothetical protein
VAINFDQTAACDRCGAWLPAAGAIHGVLLSFDSGDGSGTTSTAIVCYVNGCSVATLGGLVNHPEAVPTRPACTNCGKTLDAWSTAVAVLASDISSAGDPRAMAFCADDCGPIVLSRSLVNG